MHSELNPPNSDTEWIHKCSKTWWFSAGWFFLHSCNTVRVQEEEHMLSEDNLKNELYSSSAVNGYTELYVAL